MQVNEAVVARETQSMLLACIWQLLQSQLSSVMHRLQNTAGSPIFALFGPERASSVTECDSQLQHYLQFSDAWLNLTCLAGKQQRWLTDRQTAVLVTGFQAEPQ